MKRPPFALVLGLACSIFLTVIVSCKKNATPPIPRSIRYILYTKEDFSNVKDTIRFRLRMQTTGAAGRVLLDSNIAPMKVSQVPDSLHRLIFTKTVPAAYQNEKLVVGF